jgi:diguanylate cyclase (GGDEF)-like protein
LGVTARLLVLVLVPVTATSLMGATFLSGRLAAARQADAVDHGVGKLRDLVMLRSALHTQQSISSMDLRLEQLGAERTAAVTFLGYDWRSEAPLARAQAMGAIASLGTDSPVQAEALAALFEHIDSRAIGSMATLGELSIYLGHTDADVARGFDHLEATATHPRLLAALRSLRAVSGMVDVASTQVIGLSRIWFVSPTESPQSVTAALAQLGTATANFNSDARRLHTLGVPRVERAITELEASVEAQAFDGSAREAVDGQAAPSLVTPEGTKAIAAVFRGYFARDELLKAVVTAAVDSVRSEARSFSEAQHTAFVIWGAAMLALAGASIAIAVLVSHSLARPLKGLARYAGEVNEGHLDVEPSASCDRGPQETRKVFEVVSALITHLKLLDAKASALANGNFDDPVLSHPLPGRLGRSLETSAAQLSLSMEEREDLQFHLAHQATHDLLTGIGNRPAAIAAIAAASERAARTGASYAVMFVNLNGFKSINASHGQPVGDQVLREVGTRLAANMRSGDVVARLGGDEFVLVTEGLASAVEATDIARHLIEIVTAPIPVDELRIEVGAAIGIALSLGEAEEPLEILGRANAAMSRAKRQERSAVEIFGEDMQRQLLERSEIEVALAAALVDATDGGLELHYQPVLDVATGKMVSVEALIRWDRPGHGRLAPDAFIPIAESTSLIIDLDCWVLARAIRQLVAWSRIPELDEVTVAINISGRHLLSGTLPGHLETALDRFGVDPHRLSIEITETVLLTDLTVAAAELDAVRALGISVAIDDFGTGYTSPAHLQQLPIDVLKVDRSFVSQLGDRRGTSLVRMIIDLGHAIDLSVVAEGVETTAELAALKRMGANHIQGYLFSKPLPPQALEQFAFDQRAAHRPMLASA